MRRRTFLKSAGLSCLSAGVPKLHGIEVACTVAEDIHTVLLVTKCHLDVGFTQSQANVLQTYFQVYFPRAIEVARQLRESGKDRYTWTTGSWLLYEYLEQASAVERRTMENAIAAGDIAWHALPFSWQTEMLSRSMVRGALGFSSELDRHFGRRTIGCKMTDVPGHTRGIISPLVAGGIKFLDIGVNPASTPPEVPELFLWKDAGGNSLPVMYHRHDYGSTVVVPGSGVVVSVVVRGDNSGPHTTDEIASIYAALRERFPSARIRASNLNEVASVVSIMRERLPVITSEIGDTWIHGCASDPVKVARYREVSRMRDEWIQEKQFVIVDATDRAMVRRLLLAVEHTWGTDTKTYLDGDHYKPQDLEAVLNEPGYRVMTQSWAEKRLDVDDGIAALPAPLQAYAMRRLNSLRPTIPMMREITPHDLSLTISTQHFDLAFCRQTGAIVQLRDRQSGREWADPMHPVALFTYQTVSAKDFEAFLKRYVTIQADWAPRDFGKPGIEQTGAVSKEWHPRVLQCRYANSTAGTRICLALGIDDPEAVNTGCVAWPASLFLELWLPSAAPAVDLRLSCIGKQQNRLPEAMWLTFSPPALAARDWSLGKTGEVVSPIDVVRGGGRSMHAVEEGVLCRDAKGNSLKIYALDSPVIATGERTPLNYSADLPDMSNGVHFSLFNNAWGTNYPQWSGGDWLYRFRLEVGRERKR